MKKKKKSVSNIDLLNQKINIFNDLEKINNKYHPFYENSNSWFDIKKNLLFNNNLYHLTIDNNDDLDESLYKCKQIQFFPTSEQKLILDEWIELYRLMMNETIYFFRKQFFNKENIKTNFKKIRTLHLKNIKNTLSNNSNIYSHTLDYAIKDVCTNVKSILSNLKNKNITHFRLRYIKKNKPTQIVKIEKTAFQIKNEQIINKKIGIFNTEPIDYKKIESDLSIIRKNNRYFILLPIKIVPNDINNQYYKKVIGLDAGIRTFLTGFSQDNIIEIGNNLSSTINKRLNRIDKINSVITNERKKRKAENKRYRKIQNQINDLHWKSINYLTDNYDEIIIGKLSTSNIIQNSINKNVKRIASLMRSYVFRERLKYKCSYKNKKLKIINESYTSKICSSCGHMKTEINKSKIYECINCKSIMDRDYNGAKNIFLLGIKKESKIMIGERYAKRQVVA
jgi:putative transposase